MLLAAAAAGAEPVGCETWCASHSSPWEEKCADEWAEGKCAACRPCELSAETRPPARKTAVSIVGTDYHLNGRPTYEGQAWLGKSMEGLLMNSRMVNGIFDDLNTEQADRLWAYQDTGYWDPERNTDELIEALVAYADAGLNAITVSLQGGSPCGNNPSDNTPPCGEMYNRDSSAFARDGSLRLAFFARLERLLARADEQGIVVLLQLFYPDEAVKLFPQSRGGGGDAAIQRAADSTVDWLVERAFTNVLIDVCNECDLCRISSGLCSDERRRLRLLHWPGGGYYPVHDGQLDQLVGSVRRRLRAAGLSTPVSTSYLGGSLMEQSELRHLDYLNLHANNLWQWPDGNLVHMVDRVRSYQEYKAEPKPIIFTEDDGLCLHDGVNSWSRASQIIHDRSQPVGPNGDGCWQHFDECRPEYHSKCALGAAVSVGASWGLFLGCCSLETCPANAHSYAAGVSFQCPPVNWSPLSSAVKAEYFGLLREMTGGRHPPAPPSPPPAPIAPPPQPPPPPPPEPPPSPAFPDCLAGRAPLPAKTTCKSLASQDECSATYSQPSAEKVAAGQPPFMACVWRCSEVWRLSSGASQQCECMRSSDPCASPAPPPVDEVLSPLPGFRWSDPPPPAPLPPPAVQGTPPGAPPPAAQLATPAVLEREPAGVGAGAAAPGAAAGHGYARKGLMLLALVLLAGALLVLDGRALAAVAAAAAALAARLRGPSVWSAPYDADSDGDEADEADEEEEDAPDDQQDGQLLRAPSLASPRAAMHDDAAAGAGEAESDPPVNQHLAAILNRYKQ